MSKILIKAIIDYADEFNCEAFKVYDSIEEWDKYVDSVSALLFKDSLEEYFGTNEFLQYFSIEDLISNCEVIEITDDQAEFLRTNLRGFGTGFSAIFEIGY